MDRIRMGIIGIGAMGFAHASCIASGKIVGCELAAVCDSNEKQLKKAENAFPQVLRFNDYKQMIDDAALHAVLIAVPHPLHTEMAIYAMEHGLHVLSEKPADILYTKAQHACRVAKEQGRVYGIMFNQRMNPVYRRLKELLDGGDLGSIKRVQWTVTNWYRTQHYYDSGSWRGTWSGEGGGVLLNQAPHNLDMICMLFGLPLAVRARCEVGKYHKIAVEDEAELCLEYPGFSLHFVASTGELPGGNRMEIATDTGKLVVEKGTITYYKLAENERKVCFESEEGFVEPDYTVEQVDTSGEDTAHAGVLQRFTNAILRGTSLVADGQDGVNEIMLSNAAYLSAWTDRKVALPLCGDEFEKLLFERMKDEQCTTEQQDLKVSSHYLDRWQVRW